MLSYTKFGQSPIFFLSFFLILFSACQQDSAVPEANPKSGSNQQLVYDTRVVIDDVVSIWVSNMLSSPRLDERNYAASVAEFYSGTSYNVSSSDVVLITDKTSLTRRTVYSDLVFSATSLKDAVIAAKNLYLDYESQFLASGKDADYAIMSEAYYFYSIISHLENDPSYSDQYASSSRKRCIAGVFGSAIAGAVAGCGVGVKYGAAGGPQGVAGGCTIGAVVGAIGGSLLGYANYC